VAGRVRQGDGERAAQEKLAEEAWALKLAQQEIDKRLHEASNEAWKSGHAAALREARRELEGLIDLLGLEISEEDRET
jgi:hypothetical protein